MNRHSFQIGLLSLLVLTVLFLCLEGPVSAHHCCRRRNSAENGIFIEWNLWGDQFGTGTGGLPDHDAFQKFGCSNCNFFDGRFMFNHVNMLGNNGWMAICFHDDVNAPNLDGAWCITAYDGSNIQEWAAKSGGRLELQESTLFDKLTYHDVNYLAIDFKRPLEPKDAEIQGGSVASPYFSFKNKPQLLVMMYDHDGPKPIDPMTTILPGNMTYKQAFSMNFLDMSGQGQGLHVLWPNVDARECFNNNPIPIVNTDLSNQYVAYDPANPPIPEESDDNGDGNGNGGNGNGGGNGGGNGNGNGGDPGADGLDPGGNAQPSSADHTASTLTFVFSVMALFGTILINMANLFPNM